MSTQGAEEISILLKTLHLERQRTINNTLTLVYFSDGIQRNSMEFDEISWNSTEFHGIRRNFMEFYRIPWNSMEFYGIL